MTESKAPVAEERKDHTEPETETKSDSELAYEARNKAYAEGQELVAERLKTIAAPYEGLSNLVDAHALAEKNETAPEPTPQKKK